jgi:hypothetical protein
MRPSRVALKLGPGFVTVREAAAVLGVTEQAVHKRIREGRCSFELVDGVRVLRRDGLERRWWGSSQRLADMPPQGRAALGLTPSWDEVAARLNEFLGPGWPAPPYSADQTATLALCLGLAQGDE